MKDQATRADDKAPLSRLTVDLDAIARNYLFLKKKLAAGTDCAAVVKADAYGLGAQQIAQTLYQQGCRHFYVAEIDEALAVLRALRLDGSAGMPGQDVSVYVLDGPRGADISTFFTRGIVPVLNSLDDIYFWRDVAVQQERKLPVVLHFDTGMNRLGLNVTEVQDLAAAADVLSAFDVRHIMSHLACAENAVHAMNALQLKRFQEAVQKISGTWRLSLSNSGGIFLGPDYHFDIVRPGAALYGLCPQEGAANPMQNVLSLEGRILQVREIDADGTAGYSASKPVTRGMRTATVAVGYADGYFRSLSNQGVIFVQGQPCRVLGRVSMDSVIIDVTAVTQLVQAGDWAEVIGPHQSADAVAQQAGTIGYEVLTSLGTRLKRSYRGG